MAEKIKQNGNTYWRDSKGRLIHVGMIRPVDKKRDALVERVVKNALAMETKLNSLRKTLWDLVNKYLEWRAKDAGGEDMSWAGNLQLTNYNKTMQIAIENSNMLEFDEGLTIARNMIQDYLAGLSVDAPEALRLIIDEIFDVSKRGKVNKQMLLRLRQWNIKDPTWKKAMDIINESIRIADSVQYCYIRVRENASDKWRAVNLNFSRQ